MDALGGADLETGALDGGQVGGDKADDKGHDELPGTHGLIQVPEASVTGCASAKRAL